MKTPENEEYAATTIKFKVLTSANRAKNIDARIVLYVRVLFLQLIN